MTDLRDLSRQTLCITGRFADWSKAELEILLRGRGAWRVAPSPSKAVSVVISAETAGPKVDKARALGLPVVFADELRAALGAPLEGYRARLLRSLAERPRYIHDAVLAVGDPVSDALLARVEARIGFPLPEAARNLWKQLDGLNLLWTVPSAVQERSDALLPWSVACHGDGELWTKIHALRAQNPSRFDMGQIAIPPVETIFFQAWDGTMFDGSAYGPKDTLTLGKRKVKAQDLFSNLFMFDLFSPYYQAGLWADREQQALHVVYCSDYGADWSMAATVPLEVYLEFMLVDHGRTRPIEPSSKLGSPKSIRNLAHLSWMELAPFGA